MTETTTMCPRCKGNLRPTDHGLHPLHAALGRPICPACWIETQPDRSSRQKHREIFDVARYPTLYKERMFAELKELSEEVREARRQHRDELKRLKDSVRDEVRHEEVTKLRQLSFIKRLKLLFDPFGSS